MPHFFFFTDPDKLNNQTVVQAYGPDQTTPTEKYRVTSMHSGNNAYAYAVTEGDIIIIDNVVDTSGNALPNLVNIVLKPKNQPQIDIGYIKYYVYKGIKKSSIIDTSTNTIKPFNSSVPANNIDLLRRINSNYQKLLNQPNNTLPAIPELSQFLPNQISGGTTPLYKTFFKDSGSQYQYINSGESLGVFDDASLGFEIILEVMGFEPTVNDATKLETIIHVPQPASSSQADVFQNNNKREIILNYIDPCAFFGCFYYSSLKFNTTDSSGNASSTKCSGNEIYENIIKGLGSKVVFFNKNTVYLDIRNELDYSLDYFGNYATNGNRIIYASANTNSPVPINYYVNSWPLLKFYLSDFISGNPNNSDSKNHLFINFPKGDNYSPFIYIASGEVPDKAKFFERKKRSKKFIDLFYFNQIGQPLADFTSIKSENQTALEVLVPNYNANNVTEPISTYIKIKYLRIIESLPEPLGLNTILRSREPLDNIFQPLDMILPQATGTVAKSRTQVYYTERCINDLRHNFDSSISNIGITEDTNQNKILFTYATTNYNSKKEKNSFFSFASKIGHSNNSPGIDELIKNLNNIDYTEIELTGEPQDSHGDYPKLRIVAAKSSTALEDFFNSTPLDFKQVHLSKSEFERITTTASNAGFLNGFRVSLGFKKLSMGSQVYTDIYTSDVFTIYYAKFELVLRGYYLSTSGNVEVKEVQIPEYDVLNAQIPGTTLTKYDVLSRVLLYDRTDGNSAEIKASRLDDGPILVRTRTALNPSFKSSERGFKILKENDTPTSGITTYSICSKIYFVQNNISDASFAIYLKHFAENIQQIWNSDTNLGLPRYLNSTFDLSDIENPVVTNHDGIVINTICGILRNDKVTVRDPNGNVITNATIIIDTNPSPNNYLKLIDGECIIVVDAELGGRSYIRNDDNGDRVGRMVFDNKKQPEHTNPDPYLSTNGNVPAHEWGHVLGLSDRYTALMVLRNGNDYLHNQFTAGGNSSSSTSLAIHPEYDPEYVIQYAWRHNLMSTQTGVFPDGYIAAKRNNPLIVDPLVDPAEIFVNNYTYFFESPLPDPPGGHSYKGLYSSKRPIENVLGLLPPDYSKLNILITEQQFKLIINNNAQAGGHNENKNKGVYSGVNKRQNFPDNNSLIFKYNSELINYTQLRFDWAGIQVANNGSESLKTDYNSDGYPTSKLTWGVDTFNGNDSYVHPPNSGSSFPSINYKSSLFERANTSILGMGWLPEQIKFLKKIGDISNAAKRFNVCIGGRRGAYPSKINNLVMQLDGEELIQIHQLMIALATADLTANPRGSGNTLVDTLTQLNGANANLIAKAAELFNGKTDLRELDKTVKNDEFFDLRVNTNNQLEVLAQSTWNVRGSYYETAADSAEDLYKWRLKGTLTSNNLSNVIVKRRPGSAPNAPGHTGSFANDIEITYNIYTNAVTPVIGNGNDIRGIKLVSFKLRYTEFKNREVILEAYGQGGTL
ncbi:hypothetical protein [Fluviicola sp.]|uniref:hypothetical protein n=1 Tax=Fluviicola sp. TaxID=1917219 RepID=UPI0031DA82B5